MRGVGYSYSLRGLSRRAIKLGPYRGLLGQIDKPFTPKRHDALIISDVYMAHFAEDGAIEPLARAKR
jgi:hypothetical protein